MFDLHLSLGKFLLGWAPALALSASVESGATLAPRLADAFTFDLAGIAVPPVTCALGLLGVLMARPLAKRRENALSWPLFVLVSAIMLIVVELWIVEDRPGALFAFVVAIGMGFSGYSLIELAGDQISAFIKRVIALPTGKLGGGAATPAPKSEEELPQ